MKNQIILWLSSLIILFVIGYIKNITDKNYPLTGTFGIEGYKVSYKLDKVTYDNTAYKNIIISDIKGVAGKIITNQNDEKSEILMKGIDRGLIGEIPVQKPGYQLNYKIVLQHNGRTYVLPQKDFVTLTFWGNIPSPVNILHFILLYGGLLMSIRSVLELFNKNKNLKKYVVIGCTLFITLTILIHPLFNSYKLGAINKNIPNILELLEPYYLGIMFLWVIGAIIIFNKKYVSFVTVFISFAAILLYFLL